jgi:hypothetical protein
MEKIGNDNEARKLQRERESETTDTTTTTPGTIHAHPPSRAAVGATPLSSSSLSNYYNPHVNHNDNDDDSVETGALPPSSYHDLSGGGIMNFIFRGGKHPKANTTTNMSEHHHHNRHYTNKRGGRGG